MRLECCSGAEAEWFNRTSQHTRVECAFCGRSFCLDSRDVEAESKHRATRFEPLQGKHRLFYCRSVCLWRDKGGRSAKSIEKELEAFALLDNESETQ